MQNAIRHAFAEHGRFARIRERAASLPPTPVPHLPVVPPEVTNDEEEDAAPITIANEDVIEDRDNNGAFETDDEEEEERLVFNITQLMMGNN